MTAAVLCFALVTSCATQTTASQTATITGSSVTATAAPNTVTIKDFAFKPSPLIIKKGDTVIWINKDASPHDVKFADFKSPTLTGNAEYSHVFTETGTFDYICGLHTYMTGRIIVN